MNRVIKISNTKVAAKVNKILEEKAYIHKMIRDGKFSEIKSDIKFAKPI